VSATWRGKNNSFILRYSVENCLGQVRNVALIIAITAVMALATVAITYVFDFIPLTGAKFAGALQTFKV
jgi:hypothetical protein